MDSSSTMDRATHSHRRGSIAFFSTYRPPAPLDIYSRSLSPDDSSNNQGELHMTDGFSYNYNGQVIPSAALKAILKRPKLASVASDDDVDSGRLTGMLLVSERGNLETLHIALRLNDDGPRVYSFSDVYGTFNGIRMEDSGSIAGDYLVYVTTKDPAPQRRQPWTAVYRTHLVTTETMRLTPAGLADLSPSVSPSGKKIAVASFEGKEGGWEGEIEDLMTNIFVMDVENPLERKLVVVNGGWPTWGSENVIFFHRKVGDYWGVFRTEISNDGDDAIEDATRVTPDGIDAMTPAAIDATTVALATIRQKSSFNDVRVEAQYRHIEIFDSTGQQQPVQVTQKTKPKSDHFNPFVINGGSSIGYHRCKILFKIGNNPGRALQEVDSPYPDIGLFRVAGVFPTFSRDGSKLAFVDNEFKAVWVADSKGYRTVYEAKQPDSVWSPVWSQNPEKDILYVCMGHSFNAKAVVDIWAISIEPKNPRHPPKSPHHPRKLTNGFNNAFPSTNPQGTKFVFRSTKNGHKNLYIMDDLENVGFRGGKTTQITDGDWTDTHCEWSPSGDWIVFSSTRDKAKDAAESDNNLDPGYFAVYLLNAKNPSVVVRVIGSGNDLAGHVNHPFFSPDGNSIVVAADFAAVSADPISLPLFLHSVRPYGDIFTFDIDHSDIQNNNDLKKFNRITHSRYENSTCTWTSYSSSNMYARWNMLINLSPDFTPSCPYIHNDGGEGWPMTGHLCIPKRSC